MRHAARFFTLPAGYYGLEHILMLLGMLALCRIKSIEQLRSSAPGEWGKLLGLDRCPEAKTLRGKIKLLTTDGDGKGWAAQLCEDWMAANPAATATLYIDGHARAYHGSLTKLPRHYIARERLCLRATTDYWVNGLDGLPLFKINQAVDPGLIRALEEQIVPELELLVPNQPSQGELDADPWRMRFRLISDREGYSPGFFKHMAARRIACQTYHKHPGGDWRKLDGEVRKRAAIQHGRKARLHDLGIAGQLEPAKAEHYMRSATTLRADIEQEDAAIAELKTKRNQTPSPTSAPN